VLLAEASSRAAAQLVQINLAEHTEDPRFSAVGELAARAGAAREAALRRE
jgi:hypothetical protein